MVNFDSFWNKKFSSFKKHLKDSFILTSISILPFFDAYYFPKYSSKLLNPVFFYGFCTIDYI